MAAIAPIAVSVSIVAIERHGTTLGYSRSSIDVKHQFRRTKSLPLLKQALEMLESPFEKKPS
jgi:hypothetical protein